MRRQGKLGLGTAYIQGFTSALEHDADYLIQMDADFSHSPGYVPKFLEHIKDCDVVIGSRYVKGGRLDEQWGFHRWFLIYFEDRRIGQSKMSVRVKLEAALRVFEIRWRYQGERPAVRPVDSPKPTS